MYEIGQRVSWKGLNQVLTGTIVSFFGTFAVVKIDGSGKSILLGDGPKQKKKTQ